MTSLATTTVKMRADDADIHIQEAKFGSLCSIPHYHLTKHIEVAVFGDDRAGYKVIHYLPIYSPATPLDFSFTGKGQTLEEASQALGRKLSERLTHLQKSTKPLDRSEKLQLSYLESLMILSPSK